MASKMAILLKNCQREENNHRNNNHKTHVFL